MMINIIIFHKIDFHKEHRMKATKELLQAHTYVCRWLRENISELESDQVIDLYNVFDSFISGDLYHTQQEVDRCIKSVRSVKKTYETDGRLKKN